MPVHDEERFKVTFRPPKYEFLDGGMYRAKLVLVEDEIGQFGPRFRVTFEIVKGKCRKRRICGLLNHSSNRVSGKLWRMVRALCDKKYMVSEGLDLRSLIGNECVINVERKGDGANAISEYIHIRDLEDIERSGERPEL